jgi:hypothetical protein
MFLMEPTEQTVQMFVGEEMIRSAKSQENKRELARLCR